MVCIFRAASIRIIMGPAPYLAEIVMSPPFSPYPTINLRYPPIPPLPDR